MPITHKPVLRRQADPGIVWPSNGLGSSTVIGDVFGHRTFAAHTSGIDMHRGVDVLDNVDGAGQTAGAGGAPVYSPVNGCVIRKRYTFFQFDDAANMSQNTEVDPNSKASFARSGSNLVITGSNNGTVTFPSGLARFESNTPCAPDETDVSNATIMDFQLPATMSLVGKLCMGWYDSVNNEYAILEYNGATFTCKGKDAAGVMALDGTTAAASVKWGRIYLDNTNQTLYFQYSSTGNVGSWTTIASEIVAWTRKWPGHKAFIGFDPAASGADDTINVDMWGWGDAETISRFGNWLEIARDDAKVLLLHFRDITANVGDVVRAGQQLGITGKTGFDVLSGRIVQNHVHVEWVPNPNYIYNNDHPINPLAPSLLPRANVSSNVSAALSSAAYPGVGGGDSWKLAVTVLRADQDFDLNQVQLVGSVATRTLNYDTRAGLNPADHDANEYDSVYFEPVAFDETSASYQIAYYYKKATVGSGTPTYTVKDTAGTTLVSG